MAIAETVLKIIEISLHMVNRALANQITNEILALRSDYAEEWGKPYEEIDDGRLYSIQLRLDGIVQLYSAAAKGTPTKDQQE